MLRIYTRLFVVLALLAAAGAAAQAAPGRHVVVLVFDGMRPDFVSAETTPNLWALARDGVFFANHHPVYPSATEVNGTAIATGDYPAHSTLIGNKEYRPGIDPAAPVGTEKPAAVRRGDEISGGRYLAIPTLAEYLHAHGLRTAVAGAKQVALLADRAMRGEDAPSPVVFEGAALPPRLEAKLTAALGPFPAPGASEAGRENKLSRDAWTTRALVEVLWPDGVPPFSLLWLAEPDSSQHATGPGSSESLAAIRSSDTNLGLVLEALNRRGLRDTTDVFVVSDHGFSTIRRAIDVAAELSAAGFNATRKAPDGLRDGQILVVGNGGTVFLYVGGPDRELRHRLVRWAQAQEWAGVVFAREAEAGAFGLATAHLDSPEAPDVAVAGRWTGEKSGNGTPGLICCDGTGRGPGQGQHGSLSATDMHNTLVAAGPDFRAGVRDPVPSANTDLAPTILWILGFRDEARRRDGRVLSEALAGDAPPLRSVELQHLTARRDLGNGRAWEQYLNVTEVNGVRYLDEGNGGQVPATGTGRR